MQKIFDKIKSVYYSNNLPKYCLWLFFGFGLMVATIYTIYRLVFSVEISFEVAPRDAEVLLNGKKITLESNRATRRVRPSEYKIEIKRDEFYNFEKTYNAKFGEKIQVLIALEEINPDGDYYQNNPDEGSIWQKQADAEFAADQKTFFEKYPIGKILPKKISKYTENYGEYIEYRLDYKAPNLEKDEKMNIIITETDYECNNKDDAIKYIKDQGYNPDDYTIEYRCKATTSVKAQ